MSKEKSPIKKKQLSLQRDRRNTYGENAKAGRKNIPLAKQRSHQEERRVVEQTLHSLSGVPDEDAMVSAEVEAKIKSTIKKRKAFKKTPDTPLEQVLADKARRNKLDKLGRPKEGS